jgi:hypothetical protein
MYYSYINIDTYVYIYSLEEVIIDAFIYYNIHVYLYKIYSMKPEAKSDCIIIEMLLLNQLSGHVIFLSFPFTGI